MVFRPIQWMSHAVFGLRNRAFQLLALYSPGADSLRVWLHRWRGVHIGTNAWIGTDSILETEYPYLISIGNCASIGIRCVIIGHFRGMAATRLGEISVRIEDYAFIGPGSIVLPNVTIGRGAVVMAGSVVTKSVAPMTMVQGNPAKPVARCGIPMGGGTLKEFYRKLKPIREPEAEQVP